MSSLGNESLGKLLTGADLNPAGIALPGNCTANTPAQFDNDTSLATTEFVRRAQGNFSGVYGFSSATTLSANEVGGLIYLIGGATYTVTLPASPPQAGATYTFVNEGGIAYTISAPTGVIVYGSASSSSISIPGGSVVTLVSDGTNWHGANSVGQSSLAASGYQKLPSGLIIQWGVGAITNGTDGKSYTVTYPIAFPTACRSVTAQITNSPNNSNYSGNLVTSLTGYTAWVFDRNGAGVVGGQIYWTAIGH